MHASLRHAVRSSLLLAAFVGSTVAAHAQAMITAGRGTAVTPFGSFTLLRPDWGPQSNFGYTVGADYTHFIHSRFQPSFELRASSANGATVNEKTYLGGLQLQTPFHGIYPYATFLGGYAGIHLNYFNSGYNDDHALIYSLGGGADVPLRHGLRARLDFTRQFWNIDPQVLNPMGFSVGFAYTLGGGRGVPR